MYYVYILHSNSKNKYYVGHTQDITDRMTRHNGGRSKSTKYGIPWDLVYLKSFATKSEAVKGEIKIKSMKSKEYIEELIRSDGLARPDGIGKVLGSNPSAPTGER